MEGANLRVLENESGKVPKLQGPTLEFTDEDINCEFRIP